jgi:FkbM family methyltransferase
MNVRLHHAVLGESNGERIMQVAQGGQGFGGFSHIVSDSPVPDGRSADFEDITTMRLDDVLPSDSDIAIVQLDVEGFEEPALKGALKTIARCRPISHIFLAAISKRAQYAAMQSSGSGPPR